MIHDLWIANFYYISLFISFSSPLCLSTPCNLFVRARDHNHFRRGNVEKRFRFTNENSDSKPLSRRKKGSKESKRSRGETYDDDQQYAQGETRSEKKRRKYVEDDLSPARCKF